MTERVNSFLLLFSYTLGRYRSYPAPLMDSVNAEKAIIESLDEYGVDRNKIYIMGKNNMSMVLYDDHHFIENSMVCPICSLVSEIIILLLGMSFKV